MDGLTPILSVACKEPEGEIIHHVYPLIFTPENIQKIADKALQFPTLFSKEVKSVDQLIDLFFERTVDGLKFRGKANFFVIDDFVGMFSLTDFSYNYADALAHYTFFDRRHHGRKPLVRSMLKYVFDTYNLRRISVEVPLFTSPQTRHFVTDCGFTLEGRKRKAIKFDNTWFDILMFGILKEDILKNARID